MSYFYLCSGRCDSLLYCQRCTVHPVIIIIIIINIITVVIVVVVVVIIIIVIGRQANAQIEAVSRNLLGVLIS